MFINYFKIALRNLAKNKVHTIVNVLGLSLGLACVFLIGLYVKHEVGYDKYYPEHENLYRIAWENENPQTRTPHPMAQALAADFPEVESGVSLSPLWAAGLTREIFSIQNPENNRQFDEAGVLAVDSTFFDVFQFDVLKGDARDALRNVNGIIVTESTAKKYFGEQDPIGKALVVYPDAYLEVMAVVQDVPEQSHFHFDFLISYVREKSLDPEDEYYTWSDFGHFNYVRLQPGTDAAELEAKLLPWLRKYIDVSDEYMRTAKANNFGFRLQPVSDIHLKSHLRWELEPNGNIEYVYLMVAAALLTLIIACVNFMNLMTAKSAERSKEIGVRKTMGALRSQLSLQFVSESIVLVFVSISVALLLVEGALPFYEQLTGHNVAINYVETVPALLAMGLVVGLISSIYPSLVLASIKTNTILKEKYTTSAQGTRLRNSLIVFQFALSMILISGAIIIQNQLNYIQSKNLGFGKEEVLVVPLKNEVVARKMETLKTELLQLDGIMSVSASSNLPGGQFNQNSISLAEVPDNEISCSEVFVDHDFLKALNIELSEGRFFEKREPGDAAVNFVINQTAAKQLGGDVLDHEIHWHAYEDDKPITGRVIGITKDFHYQSFHEALQPLIMISYPAYNHLVIKMNTSDIDRRLAQIESVYAQFDNDFKFEFSFLEDRLSREYLAEQRTGVLFSAFAVIAIIVSCCGLFAMAMLSFAHRIKEISVRKVLGASSLKLVVMLLSNFTKLIVLASVIATPLAWWTMEKWIQNFKFQATISPIVFVLSGVVLVLVSWFTLGYIIIKTSNLNPAQTLKNE